ENAVVELDLGEQVAGVLLAALGDVLLLGHLLAGLLVGHPHLLLLDILLDRDGDLAVELLEPLDLDLPLDGGLDRLLAATLDLHHIPFFLAGRGRYCGFGPLLRSGRGGRLVGHYSRRRRGSLARAALAGLRLDRLRRSFRRWRFFGDGFGRCSLRWH